MSRGRHTNKMKTRTDILNNLIEKFAYKTYLEIGVGNSKLNFDSIKAKQKTGVDPAVSGKFHQVDFAMSSDEYFASLPGERKFDLIFIDGLHLEKQVIKDIVNSIEHLSLNGTIVVHDCNPQRDEEQVEDYDPLHSRPNYTWSGTVWKAVARFRMLRHDVFMFVVDTDCGVGIIKKGRQEKYPYYEVLDWNFLKEHRKALLNLKDVSEFEEWLKHQK